MIDIMLVILAVFPKVDTGFQGQFQIFTDRFQGIQIQLISQFDTVGLAFAMDIVDCHALFGGVGISRQ
ncbi:hypothetical protein [Shewanella algae]|uniref:hypothetical protein n=1 Tax=Shewanella algae TaxID=38313 RepID=UPI000D3FE42A|nr:hypothetical protein [Shewanella algae]PST68635.1 hypothetical protein AYI77_00560 [Shewanella algae]